MEIRAFAATFVCSIQLGFDWLFFGNGAVASRIYSVLRSKTAAFIGLHFLG
jgi:hypothetical protein